MLRVFLSVDKTAGFVDFSWQKVGFFLFLYIGKLLDDMFNKNYGNMKKILLSAIAALFAVTAASAQDAGNWAVGPRMNIYTNTGETVVGLGAYGRYNFDGNWRIEPSVMALLHEGCSLDISCDAQYVFHVGSGWHLYPAAGLTVNDIGRWAAGLNIGGGFDVEVAQNWDISAGLKWQPMFDDIRPNPVVISVGASYKF